MEPSPTNSGLMVTPLVLESQAYTVAKLVADFLPGIKDLSPEVRASLHEAVTNTTLAPEHRSFLEFTLKTTPKNTVTLEKYEAFIHSLAESILLQPWQKSLFGVRSKEFERDYNNHDHTNGINAALHAAQLDYAMAHFLPNKIAITMAENGLIITRGKVSSNVPGCGHHLDPLNPNTGINFSNAPCVVAQAPDVLVAIVPPDRELYTLRSGQIKHEYTQNGGMVFARKPDGMTQEEWRKLTPENLLNINPSQAPNETPFKSTIFIQGEPTKERLGRLAPPIVYFPSKFHVIGNSFEETPELKSGHYSLISDPLRVTQVPYDAIIGYQWEFFKNAQKGDWLLLNEKGNRYQSVSPQDPYLHEGIRFLHSDETGKILDPFPKQPGTDISTTPNAAINSACDVALINCDVGKKRSI